MLELELGGRKITTMDDKQILTVNGTPIEVEKIGQAIYFNKFAVNLVIPEKANKGSIPVAKILGTGGVLVAAILAATNYETIIPMAINAFDAVVPYVDSGIDWVMSYVADTTEAPAAPTE